AAARSIGRLRGASRAEPAGAARPSLGSTNVLAVPCRRPRRRQPACQCPAVPPARSPRRPRYVHGTIARGAHGRPPGHADVSVLARGCPCLRLVCEIDSGAVGGSCSRRTSLLVPAFVPRWYYLRARITLPVAVAPHHSAIR